MTPELKALLVLVWRQSRGLVKAIERLLPELVPKHER